MAAAFITALLLLSQSPAEIIEAGKIAYSQLTPGQEIFVKAVAKNAPLPELVGFAGDTDRYVLSCSFERGSCGFVTFSDTTGILDVYAVLVDRKSIEEGTVEICRWKRCVIRGQNVIDTLAQDRKLKRVNFIAAAVEDDVLERIGLDNSNVRAVLNSLAVERSRHDFSAVETCFYIGIVKGRYQCRQLDGSTVEIAANELRPEELKWIKKYRDGEDRYRKCAALLKIETARERSIARRSIIGN